MGPLSGMAHPWRWTLATTSLGSQYTQSRHKEHDSSSFMLHSITQSLIIKREHMPLVTETITKNWVSCKQADNQAEKPGLKLIPLLYRHLSESGWGPTERKQSHLQGARQPFIRLGNLNLENIIFSCFSLIGATLICMHSHQCQKSL